jgi:predicted nuclease of predicted toxin-antitoxin system
LRLLLDEHLSPVIAGGLRSRGHDVVAALNVGLTRVSDADVLRRAVGERRAVVTLNIRDFRRLHSTYLASGQVHFGIILLSRPRFSTAKVGFGQLISALDTFLSAHPDDEALTCLEHWL